MLQFQCDPCKSLVFLLLMETDRTLIVVPTYNERENVGALVVQLLQIAPESDVLIID